MTTKTTKAAKASKKTTTLHIAIPGSGKPICGVGGKGIKTTLTLAEATCADCQKVAAHAEEKTRNEAKSQKTEKPEVRKAAKPVAAPPRERDPRLPPVGTVIKKVDRAGNVRCEVTVEADGIRYKGTLYRSLSAAAMAAAKDQGTAGSVNGFLYFGLIRYQAKRDPIEALDAAWARYQERAATAFASSKDDKAALAKVKAALAGQAKKIEQLAQRAE